MTESAPAWTKASAVLQIPDFVRVEALTPEWALDGATGAGVRVAIVDSGIEADHPWLGDCVDVDGAADFSVDADGSVVITDGPHTDVFGHGTACAGIIHAIAPQASITSVRVLGPRLRGKAAAFHAGLQWAVDEGFDVINLSLGAGKRDWALPFHEVCDRAYFNNSFIVTAANNMQRASFPSLYAAVTSVACNTSDNPLRFHFNPEPPTEFLARGIDIEVPWLDGSTTVTTGNSFAAPHIAGFAALIKSKHPNLRPFHVKAALWACSANVRDKQAPVEAAGRSTMSHGTIGRGTISTRAIPASLPTTTIAAVLPDEVISASRASRAAADAELAPSEPATAPAAPPPPPAMPGSPPSMPGAASTQAPVVRPGGPTDSPGAPSQPAVVRPTGFAPPPPADVQSASGPPKMPGRNASPLELELQVAQAGLVDIELTGLVSRGAWGSVYAGVEADGTHIAVRRIDRALAGDESLIERFVTSVRTAAEIDHQHVLPILELVDCDAFALIVMPLCPSNLAEIAAAEQQLAPIDVGAAALSLLAGLDAAHRVGVFHGDLRPKNALIDHHGRVVVSDVGLAAPLQANSRSTVGTDLKEWVHRAPEQVRGEALGASTDLYAVASISYQLLTGDLAWPAPSSFAEVLTRSMNAERPPPLATRGTASPVSPALASIFEQCLTPSPIDRFATATDFAHALDHTLTADYGATWAANSRFTFQTS